MPKGNKMSMDAFTAQTLLQAVANGGDNDRIADLYKGLQSKSDGGPSQKDIDFFNANEGKRVKINYTGYEGVLESLNISTGGFYPGSRYPFNVRITTEGEAKDCLFEYDGDQVEVIK